VGSESLLGSVFFLPSELSGIARSWRLAAFAARHGVVYLCFLWRAWKRRGLWVIAKTLYIDMAQFNFSSTSYVVALQYYVSTDQRDVMSVGTRIAGQGVVRCHCWWARLAKASAHRPKAAHTFRMASHQPPTASDNTDQRPFPPSFTIHTRNHV
jgi:hypothetical protein